MTETETIAAAINQIDEKKQNLKKAFDDLQSHRSLLSPSFPLSWSDIDSHFSSLQSSLSNRLRLLQSTADPETPPPVTVRPELRALCEKMDSIGLTKFLTDHWDDDDGGDDDAKMPSRELSAAFRYSPDPARMVLDAIDGDGGGGGGSSKGGKSVDVRRVFVLLMEALIDFDNAKIGVDTKEKAKKVADEWETKIGNKPFEALLFLHLVAAFELGAEFNSEELSRYVVMIAKYKQATLLCNKLGLGKERVGEMIIKKLLSGGKPILAVRFMYECGRTDGFDPVSVLKGYVKESREAAERVSKEGKYSLKSRNEATDKEVSALKAVIKIIKDRNLEAEFAEERVEERVEELEKQKAQRKRNVETKAKPKGRKRPRDRSGGGSTQVPRREACGVMTQPSHHHGLQVPRREACGVMTEPSHHHGLQVPRREAFGVMTEPSHHHGLQVPRREACGVMTEPSHHHGLQLNQHFGVVNPARGGILGRPYMMNPLAAGVYGSAPPPQPGYYGQQTGFVMPPFHPSYYPQ